MIFNNLIIASVVGLAVTSSRASAQECTSVESITCSQVSTPPTLDGSTDDWTSVDITEAPLTGAMNSIAYPHGNAKIRCVHDTNKVYFLFEIPGLYRFDTEDNHMCAAVSSMFKMGEDAKLFNMGGCPLALTDCPADGDGAHSCDDYKVDIGGHWELKTTEQGVYFGTNDGTGDDAVANKDDEYAVSPKCRMDDDDELAANEWEGAWLYVNGTGSKEVGRYVFEMARSLKTKSEESDKQMEVGKAVEFGFAFWDPYEREDGGWTDAGHFVTGCSEDWISLRLVDENGELDTEETSLENSIEETSIATANGEETSTNDVGVSPSTADSSSDAVFVSYLGLAAASLVLATYCLY